MGICISEEAKRSKALDDKLKDEENKDKNIYKLLLLGPGESGKSTFFKQIVCSFGSSFPRDYRVSSVPSIHLLILQTIKILINQADILHLQVSPEIEESRQFLDKLDENSPIDAAVAWHITKLWKDKAIRQTFNRQYTKEYSFYLPDSAEYFLKQVGQVADRLYVPSNQDLFRIRTPTTGILETTFMLRGVEFLLVDVGGQRNERRKWIHSFDKVSCVLFVMALSEYDHELYEDAKVNRLAESFDLFEQACNLKVFADTPVICFLNKMDLFEKKVKIVPLSKFRPDFTGVDFDMNSALAYFKETILRLNKNPKRRIYFHPTQATDTKKVKKLFDSVRDSILRDRLEKAALM